MFTRIRGTRDIFDTQPIHNILLSIENELLRGNFSKIQVPILESTELFQRSLGQETEVIAKEMFLVRSMHESDEAICLRPEATASIMRAFLTQRLTVSPWRVFTTGSMFRHERPQKGRYREFTQTSIEIIGGVSPAYDAELIALLEAVFSQHLQLRDYALEINFLGQATDRLAYKEAVVEFIHSFQNIPEKVLHTAQKNLLRIFDLKDEECRKFLAQAPTITDYLSTESSDSWQLFKSFLNALAINYVHNPRLVRGLDYYNNTVFEFVSHKLGAQNTFCGGGRYDDLATILGSRDKVPAIGAAIGIDRLTLMLEEQSGAMRKRKPFFAAVADGNEYTARMLSIVMKLREAGFSAELYADKTSLKSAFRKADSDGAQAMLILGEKEDAESSIAIKDMVSGNQVMVLATQIIEHCLKQYPELAQECA